MSFSVDVYIQFKGARRVLVRILEDRFIVRIDPEHYWLLDFIEIALSRKREFPEAFDGKRFQAYDYVLSGTTYMWSSDRGSIRDAHAPVMDVLAQGLAFRLRSRTAIRIRDDAEHRRYKYSRAGTGRRSWTRGRGSGRRVCSTLRVRAFAPLIPHGAGTAPRFFDGRRGNILQG